MMDSDGFFRKEYAKHFEEKYRKKGYTIGEDIDIDNRMKKYDIDPKIQENFKELYKKARKSRIKRYRRNAGLSLVATGALAGAGAAYNHYSEKYDPKKSFGENVKNIGNSIKNDISKKWDEWFPGDPDKAKLNTEENQVKESKKATVESNSNSTTSTETSTPKASPTSRVTQKTGELYTPKATPTSRVSNQTGELYTVNGKIPARTYWKEATNDRIEAMRNTADFKRSLQDYANTNLSQTEKERRAAADVIEWNRRKQRSNKE